MIQVVFKICYTDQSIRYDVPGHWTTEYFFHKIRDYLSVDFDIPNAYLIVPGPGLQIPQYRGFPEAYPPVELSSVQSLIEYCNPNEVNAFYIRFLDEPDSPDVNEIRRVHINPITS